MHRCVYTAEIIAEASPISPTSPDQHLLYIVRYLGQRLKGRCIDPNYLEKADLKNEVAALIGENLYFMVILKCKTLALCEAELFLFCFMHRVSCSKYVELSSRVKYWGRFL